MPSFFAPFRMVLRMPQPLKTLFWLALPAWILAMIGTTTAQPNDAGNPWYMMPCIVIMTAAGLVYALDIRGNASRLSELSREEKMPMTFPTALVRALGVGIVIMGIIFIWLILSGRS